ncbi:hypothetical protein ACFL2Q_11360 [Thermodesulfobacteriota bacterium]
MSKRAIIIGFACAAVFVCGLWFSGNLSAHPPAAVAQQTYQNIRIENASYSNLIVVIVGRGRWVYDWNDIPAGTTRVVSEGHLYSGWRAVCWWNRDSAQVEPECKTVMVNQHDQVITVP